MKTNHPLPDNTLLDTPDTNILNWIILIHLDWEQGFGSKKDFLVDCNNLLWSLLKQELYEDASKLKMKMKIALKCLSEVYHNTIEIPVFKNESFKDYESRVLEHLIHENEVIFLSMGYDS